MKNYQVGGHIVDVVNKRLFDGTINVVDGRISEIRECPVPQDAPYIMPGFVDSHIHIESTLLSPAQYAALAVTKGVVAIATDPHEIANVCGMEGMDFMMGNAAKVRFHFHFGAPSCVPCTGFETAGAVLDHNDIASLLKKDEVYGVAEFMNAFGVVSGDPECQAKLKAARDAGKPVDGHAPGIGGDMLRNYAAAGITTDHECVTLEEGQERLDCGIKVQIREGSAASDFEALSPLLASNGDNLMFCSDDKYPNELKEGYIDTMVSKSVKKGYPLWNVLNAACLTPAIHYNMKHGLLREGDAADFIVVDSLTNFNVLATYIDGVKVFGEGSLVKEAFFIDDTPESGYPNKFAAERIAASDLSVKKTGEVLKVMVARDLSLRTGLEMTAPKTENGFVVPDIDRDILKLVVYNRYVKAAPQVAFIKGFNLKSGAMASTIAHDSHNIIAIGTSDEEIAKVINALVEIKGGIAISDGRTMNSLPLPIAGLMTPEDGDKVAEKYRLLKRQASVQGCPFNAPYMTMAFMALPVIPDIKLTDKGLFDATTFTFTSLME